MKALYGPGPALSLLRALAEKRLVADEPLRALRATGCGRAPSSEPSEAPQAGLFRGGGSRLPRLLRRELWSTAEAPLSSRRWAVLDIVP